MKRHILKDGNYVDVRDPDEVTTRGRRSIQSISLSLKSFLEENGVKGGDKFSDINFTEEQADAMLRLQEAVVAATVMGWSYPEAAPTLQTVGDMPAGRFDEISELTRHVGASIALDTQPTLDPDPAVPFGNSEPSAGS